MRTGNAQEIRIGSREAAILRRRRWTSPTRVALNRVALIQPLPAWVWIATAVLCALAVKTRYAGLTVGSIAILPVLASLLRFKGDSNVLLAACATQWLQVVLPVYYCDFENTSLQMAFQYPNMETATQLSLFGILSLAAGMRIGLWKWGTGAGAMESESADIALPRLIRLWWFSFFVSSFASRFAWKAGALAQVFYAIAAIKWVVFYIFTYKVLTCGQGRRQLVVALFVEFGKGLLGYFGSFKEVLFMFLLAAVSLARTMTLRVRVISLVVISFGIVAGVYWSALKMEYRAYLVESWQKRGQELGLEEKVDAIKKIYARYRGGIMDIGIDKLIERVSYTQLFGATLDNVPLRVPHENGELWKGAIEHVLMPRILFPKKAILDDSSRAQRYTGLNLAGAESGTSIGIGYMADSYVDFGRYGMMVPIFLLGVVMGLIYRHFTMHKRSRLWGSAIATSIIFSVLMAYAMENGKLLGGIMNLTLFLWVLDMAFGKSTWQWLTEETVAKRRLAQMKKAVP